jgi:hypothetical protein
MNGPLLSRQQLQDALERLAHHLHRRGVHAELYLFGGGAMVLGYNARDATMDLDTAIRQHHGAVLAEARVVAAELGLPSWWLNEQATSYLPPGDDSEARAVLDRPGLRVIVASPRHLLAMKVRAARQSDIADISSWPAWSERPLRRRSRASHNRSSGASPSANEAELCSPISTTPSTTPEYLSPTGGLSFSI